MIHVVKAGESLYAIARDYGVNPLQLAAENGLSPQDTLVVGQTLVVLFPRTLHIVRAGETLSSIARRYGTDVRTLWRSNRWLEGKSDLNVGTVLVISYFRSPLGSLSVSGYAYPAIAPETLQGALPYLTTLVPFTYGIGQDGTLLPLGDEALREAARRMGVGTLLHLSTVTEQGNFSNGRASMLLEDEVMQERLCGEILSTVQTRGFSGVDVDFEFVFPQEAGKYARFVERLRDTLHPYGRSVTVALAPKTSADQKGLLYEGHDYAMLGAAADRVFLMTYEWGYTYGPPMAVAPLPQVERVLRYALAEIPREKITLGIPTYGYDWRLPYRQGDSKARSLSNVEAVALARRYGARIQYDDASASPWFRYWDEAGREHEVWFEDARSIAAKLQLALRREIAGIGYWNLDRPFPENWLILHALVDIA